MATLHIEKAEDMIMVAKAVLDQVANRTGAAVVALHGDLGAGKTTLVQAIAKELGITDETTSPTFVIMKLYETASVHNLDHLVHIDAYRIEHNEEMKVLGFEEILATPNTLVCIEWAENIKGILPKDIISVSITIPESGEGRDITINGD